MVLATLAGLAVLVMVSYVAAMEVFPFTATIGLVTSTRSEERRVGKECM